MHNSFACLIKHPHAGLAVRVSLFCAFAKILHRLCIIGFDTRAVGIDKSQIIPGLRLPGVGSLVKPLQSLGCAGIRALFRNKPFGLGLLVFVSITILIGLSKAVFRHDPAAVVLPLAFLVIALLLSSRFLRLNVVRLILRMIKNALRSR